MLKEVTIIVEVSPDTIAIPTLYLKAFQILSEYINNSLYHFNENPFHTIDFPSLNEYTINITRGGGWRWIKEELHYSFLYFQCFVSLLLSFINNSIAIEVTIIRAAEIVEARGQFLVTVRCWAIIFPNIVACVPPSNFGTAYEPRDGTFTS